MTNPWEVFSVDHVCPYCRLTTECHATAQGQMPEDGDISLCFHCGQFGIFSSPVPGGLRRPTSAESVEIGYNTTCQRMKRAWREVKKQQEDK